MNPEQATPSPFDQAEFQAAELAVLRRALAASRGQFSLSLATCNDPSLRDYLISKLRADDPGIEAVAPPDKTTDALAAAQSLASDAKRSALFVIGLEGSLPSTEAPGPDNPAPEARTALEALNASRERWPKAFDCPVVFWLGEYACTFLSLHAPDFWSWISHRFQFVSERATAAAAMSEAFTGTLSASGELAEEQKRLRLAELEARIHEAGEAPSKGLSLHLTRWLTEAGVLHHRMGDLDMAEAKLRVALGLFEDSDQASGIAWACNNLGNVCLTRGELDEAEAMYRRALEIHVRFGHIDSVAGVQGNIGTLLAKRGDLDGAEALLREALDTNEKLGRMEEVAAHYNSLGVVFRVRGDLDGAAAMYRKAIEIDERLGQLSGVAFTYGNLGNVLAERGDLDGAEVMHRKAMEIDEKLGHTEGIARNYANLGSVLEQRGALERARKSWIKARDLYAKIGAVHEVKMLQDWIDGLHAGRAEAPRPPAPSPHDDKGATPPAGTNDTRTSGDPSAE